MPNRISQTPPLHSSTDTNDLVVFLTLRTGVIPGRAAWREPGIQR